MLCGCMSKAVLGTPLNWEKRTFAGHLQGAPLQVPRHAGRGADGVHVVASSGHAACRHRAQIQL